MWASVATLIKDRSRQALPFSKRASVAAKSMAVPKPGRWPQSCVEAWAVDQGAMRYYHVVEDSVEPNQDGTTM